MNKPLPPLQHIAITARTGAVQRLCLAMLAMLCVGTAGCAYRITIQQGNFLEEETVDQVEVGMTREQVQYLLGTPMVKDPFHADRWDYLYYVIYGRRRRVVQAHFIVNFANERVASVERFTDSG